MATARIRINLMKWEECKAIGESPKAFEERMQYFISGHTKELNRYVEKSKKATNEHDRNYYEGGVKYEQRKLKSINREINKAKKDA